MKKCIVIGGGIVGLCSAYYLAKAGHRVTIIDKSDLLDGCSYGNAGMIVPSHFVPLAQPGMIAKGLRWMFDSKSPFYIKPRMSTELLKWGISFYQHANQKHVADSTNSLLSISLMSKELYQEMDQENPKLAYQDKGLLMLFQTNKVGDEEMEVGEMARKMGLNVDFLDQSGLKNLEPNIDISAAGGVYYKSDAHIYPNEVMAWLKGELIKMEVEIESRQEVIDIELSANKKISSVKTLSKTYQADEFVLCTGSWSPLLAKKIGVKIKLLPGKGYSFNPVKNEAQQAQIPTILCEGKVAVSPFEDTIRYSGTMEITHVKDTAINTNRVIGIVNTINSFYPKVNLEMPKKEDLWYGFRPCTPTGMPIISKHKKITNLTICAGHGMMGMSLGPASGKLVEEIISEKKTSIAIGKFKLV